MYDKPPSEMEYVKVNETLKTVAKHTSLHRRQGSNCHRDKA